MSVNIPDSAYVTGSVPPEMREGFDNVDVAPPTTITDVDGQMAQLTRVSVPRPAHIPIMPRVDAPIALPLSAAISPPAGTLQYDFPLLPSVQCRVIFVGELTADHLEQLRNYLEVACSTLREQQVRTPTVPKGIPKQKPKEKPADGQ